MTDLQKHVMQLVKEIQDTCGELGIPFALYGKTAGRAVKNKRFRTQCCEFHIMMLARDIPTLKKTLQKKRIKDRGWDDLSCNPGFPTNNLRYVDLATTLIDKEYGKCYEKLGVAVTIHPLYSNKPAGRIKRLTQGMIFLNHGVKFSYYDMLPWMENAINTAQHFVRRFGRKFSCGIIYHELKKEKRAKQGSRLYLYNDEAQLVSVPAEVITNTEMIVFEENYRLPVSVNRTALFEKLYEENWKKESIAPIPSANRIWVISDADKPYEQSLRELKEAGIDIRELQKDMVELTKWSEEVMRPEKQQADTMYEYARRSVDRIDLYHYYKDKMEEFKQASDNKEYKKLEALMKPYLQRTEYYYGYHLGFYITPELFEYAKKLWIRQKKKAYAQEIEQMIPEIYRNESIEVFLEKYQKEDSAS